VWGSYEQVWWIDFGWLPGAHHATLSLHLLNYTGGEKYDKGLWVQKYREISEQLPSWAKQEGLSGSDMVYSVCF